MKQKIQFSNRFDVGLANLIEWGRTTPILEEIDFDAALQGGNLRLRHIRGATGPEQPWQLVSSDDLTAIPDEPHIDP